MYIPGTTDIILSVYKYNIVTLAVVLSQFIWSKNIELKLCYYIHVYALQRNIAHVDMRTYLNR